MTDQSDPIAVRSWLMEAPLDDPIALRMKPDFSYEHWFDEGRHLPNIVPVLIALLQQEDTKAPSPLAERAAYALGFIGDGRATQVLLQAIKSADPGLRSEAAASLGRVGVPVESFAPLRQLASDDAEDENVRANACISIGRLAPPGAASFLASLTSSPNSFVARAAAEGLRMLPRSEPN